MRKFCFLCGKKTSRLIKGYCEECYNKEFKLIELPKEVSLKVCRHCSKIEEKNKWKDISPEEFVIKNEVKILGKNVKLEIKREEDVLIISAIGNLEKSEKIKREVYEVVLKIKKSVCPFCSKKGRYFESVMQLRGNFSDKEINFIKKVLDASENTFYNIKKVKKGIDIYINRKFVAKRISKIVSRKYKCEVVKSFELITRKEGKNIYKNVILLRFQ
jgi:nonsense-mediated mRNA decay protein 3